jgi:hypothetical protein
MSAETEREHLFPAMRQGWAEIARQGQQTSSLMVKACGTLRGRLDGQRLVELGEVALQRFGREYQGERASLCFGVEQSFVQCQTDDFTRGGAAQPDNRTDAPALNFTLNQSSLEQAGEPVTGSRPQLQGFEMEVALDAGA